MKKILVAFTTLLLLSTAAVAQQRYAIIDTKYILGKIPEYKDANKKLEDMADAWQKEIDLMLKNGFKLEVESLISKDISYVTEEYVPQRLEEAEFLD